jgi:O-antigen ligase
MRPAAFALGFATPAALAFANGGYFPSEWGLAALGFLLAAAVALIVREGLELGRLDAVLPGALALLLGWTLLSAAWAPSAAQPVLEAERTLVYLAAALCAAVVLGRESVGACVAGVAAGAGLVAVYALVVADPGEQLAEPIGYWNSLGILCVLGLLTGARAGLLGAALLPALATALYLTFSRGSLLALALGVAALVALDHDRFRLLALAPAPVLAVAAAALTDDVPFWAIAAAAVLAVVLARLAPRLDPSPRVRRAVGAVLAVGAVGLAVAALVRIGNPVDAFTAPLPPTGGDLGGRLTSASGNGRADYWRVAWNAVEDDPLRGAGAGEYGRRWLLERPTAFAARDAHNLYLETLAELGPLGLALLLAVLAVPLAALIRARAHPAAAPAGAGYAAFLGHAAVDWDWEVPAVTATALLLGASIVALARDGASLPLTLQRRLLGLAALLPLVAAAAVAHAGNRALSASVEAIERGDGREALAKARRARTWMPWSYEPWQRLGEAYLVGGRPDAARSALREALERDDAEWSVWYDLAAASEEGARGSALARAEALNPRGPEIDELRAESG